jgi:hypothetical protein
MIGGRFARSKFIEEKVAIPKSFIMAYFRPNFKIEDGKVVGYLNDNKIFSAQNPSEVADFDEALQVMVNSHPDKDNILKGAGASGSGTPGKPGASNMPASFNVAKATAAEKAAFIQKHGVEAFKQLPRE